MPLVQAVYQLNSPQPEISRVMVQRWKREAMKALPDVFSGKAD
ncbi:MAG: hypothetical protein ACE5FU_02445 [Nitrospinota bacterium]